MKIGGFVKKLMNPEYAISLMLGVIFMGVGLGLVAPMFLANGTVASQLDAVFADPNVTATAGLGTTTSATLSGLVYIIVPLVIIAGVIGIFLYGNKK